MIFSQRPFHVSHLIYSSAGHSIHAFLPYASHQEQILMTLSLICVLSLRVQLKTKADTYVFRK